MVLKIIENDCINCGACEPECPNNAIYEAGSPWKLSDRTSVNSGLTNGEENNDIFNSAISDICYYIAPNKCTECVGFYNEPKCASVCPVDCCVVDETRNREKLQ